jgi:MFS superfamily sulfate permease-like transporter
VKTRFQILLAFKFNLYRYARVRGGMGGCAMIGQSMINVNAGGRTRLSGLTCAAALMAYVLVGSSLIEKIPLAALTGTMFMLVCDIFDWTSFKRLTQIPKTDAAVLCLVTGVTVVTNLAVAVLAGVVLASLGFAWKSAQNIQAGLYNSNPADHWQKITSLHIKHATKPFYALICDAMHECIA